MTHFRTENKIRCESGQINSNWAFFLFYLKRKITNVNKKIHVFELSIRIEKTGKPGATAAQVLRFNPSLKQKQKTQLSTLKPDLKYMYSIKRNEYTTL